MIESGFVEQVENIPRKPATINSVMSAVNWHRNVLKLSLFVP